MESQVFGREKTNIKFLFLAKALYTSPFNPLTKVNGNDNVHGS